MELRIIFENDQFLVVNKPAPLVVNRSETTKEETLQDQLAKYFKLATGDLGIGGRAGIVHRLDRETSGVMLVAKTRKAFDFLQEQFKSREVQKEYIALVHGLVKNDSGEIESMIGRIGKFGRFGNLSRRQEGGKEAETHFRVLERLGFENGKFGLILEEASRNLNKARINYLKKNAVHYCLLSVMPKTGRTHQIRVHLKSIGHPVVSDLIYAPAKLIKFDFFWCPRLFLHAQKIQFPFRQNGKSRQFVFEAPLPYDLEEAKNFLVKLPDERSI